MSYYPGNGPGGKGAAVLYALNVMPGQQFPVVVGAGGAGGRYANIPVWKPYMNGAPGGASSFGTVSAEGGGGGKQNQAGAAGEHISEAGADFVHFQTGNSGSGGAASTQEGVSGGAGSAGFVVVTW